MHTILDWLEWLAKYGIIDIVFGIGVIGLLWRGVRRVWPQKLQHLHVSTHAGTIQTEKGTTVNALIITISNLYDTRLYISRAIFRPFRRKFVFWKQKSKLNIHPGVPRIVHIKSYELRLGEKQPAGEPEISDYDALVEPRGKAYSALALSDQVQQEFIDSYQCGTIVLEYSLAGKSGRHIVRV